MDFRRAIQSRQLEIERLPIRIQDQVKEQFFLRTSALNARLCERFAPVRLVEFDAVPGLVRARSSWFRAYASALGLQVSQDAAARLSRVTNRCTSACFASSVQSNQLVSLSWQ